MAKVIKLDSQITTLKNKPKVAAYARVSEATDMTHRSLSAQVSYYKKLITSNPEWEFVGVYIDEGISGRNTKLRDEFNRMIDECKKKKIDIVLVKSISRFARDTVDCLNTIRELKKINVAVYFERENINSLTADGELLLTLLASFAQEESRSISGNVKWGIKKKFEEGIQNGYKEPYGYKWDGQIYRIIFEEGQIVKEIYRRYLAGESAYIIAKDLAKRGVKGRQGNPIEQTTVKEILSNIAYSGDMILQKNYITENKVRKRNKGELAMYLVENMYEPLVSKEDFEKSVAIRKIRAENMPNKDPELTKFSGLIKCGTCGKSMSRRNAKNKKRWVCNNRERNGMASCDSRPISEEELYDSTYEIMGSNDYSVDEFKEKISKIIVYGDRLEFVLKNNKIKSIIRHYTGLRGSNPFTNKIYCGECNSKCIRKKAGKRGKAWYCSKSDVKPLYEQELIKACIYLFGNDYQGKIVEYIKKIIVLEKIVSFEYKDGDVKTWQRE